jgi:hypothetical protein
MQVGISDEERDALIAFLRERINSERLPRSSRLALKRFLSKIEPVLRADGSIATLGRYSWGRPVEVSACSWNQAIGIIAT